ncbi:MAG TPA: hypothetical protein VJA26_11935, partial [Gammaproteobacteria bacterium]|nr:hypothetical protein [Gammaproteobacteria bacterium]
MADDRPWPQAGRTRMIARSPLGNIGTGEAWDDHDLLAKMDAKHVFMMGAICWGRRNAPATT